MKFALINEQRKEAQPNLAGQCPVCRQPMTAKCGDIKIWHWAHKGRRHCDSWWENETEWHRGWKGRFPESWQEVVHQAANGEKHVADVKTERGWVLEFQRSHIDSEERRSRDSFYKKLVWVVDGTRRKRDEKQFFDAWDHGKPIGYQPPLRTLRAEECKILQEWGGVNAPVFIDFGHQDELWWLLRRRSEGSVYVALFSRAGFVEIHRSGATQTLHDIFEAFVTDLGVLISQYESQFRHWR